MFSKSMKKLSLSLLCSTLIASQTLAIPRSDKGETGCDDNTVSTASQSRGHVHSSRAHYRSSEERGVETVKAQQPKTFHVQTQRMDWFKKQTHEVYEIPGPNGSLAIYYDNPYQLAVALDALDVHDHAATQNNEGFTESKDPVTADGEIKIPPLGRHLRQAPGVTGKLIEAAYGERWQQHRAKPITKLKTALKKFRGQEPEETFEQFFIEKVLLREHERAIQVLEEAILFPYEVSGMQMVTKQTVNIDASSQRLIVLPISLGKDLKDTYTLKLRRNVLTEIPPQLGGLSQLVELDLAGNLIRTLPEELGKIQTLKKLYVQDNELEKLPEGIGELINLNELNVARNQLHSLPHTIVNLGKVLLVLDLTYNPIKEVSPQVYDWLNRIYLSHNLKGIDFRLLNKVIDEEEGKLP